MPIDEGVNVDLQFLILEVKKQAQASLSYIEKPTKQKLAKILGRENYVNNLKKTLENKSYFNLNLEDEKKQLNYFRALITIAQNLEHCADYFERVANQMDYVTDPGSFDSFDLRQYYKVINSALAIIHPALTGNNLELAQEICDYEEELDVLYAESFEAIRGKLRKREQVDDMLSLLFITRYLERVGDSFLNIGEAILDIHVGEKMGIKQFRHLLRGLESQGIDISSEDVEFKPIMDTRSGSRVAKIQRGSGSNGQTVFYKEGARKKIDQEVTGLRRWQSKYPGSTPEVLWHEGHKDHSTILLEYIQGDDLLEILIKDGRSIDPCLKLLTKSLRNFWQSSLKHRPASPNHIKQLVSRKSDVKLVHDQLFELNEDLDAMLSEARKMERELKAPFSVLLHGDFNVDNIIFSNDHKRMFFIDVHRSGYGDYSQDVSVFLVSNFRVPIFSPDIRKRLNEANISVYECALSFARKNKDETFEVRLALGLFRSLITSTRFMFDKKFSADMFLRANAVLRDVLDSKDNLRKFRLSRDYFLYG